MRVLLIAGSLLASARAAGPSFCGTCANGGPPPMQNTQLSLSCSAPGATIAAISFASYGTPTGACPAFAKGACDAPTSLAVVTAACVGRAACSVYPNTTTFPDPCFGTAKELRVVAACTAGAGAGACSTPPPPPPPPPPANFSALVSLDFGAAAAGPNPTLRCEPSIQVVSQHLLFAGSPIYAAAWATLAQLSARLVRFVPWIPYPATGVAELMPPSGAALCAPQQWAGGQTAPVALDCGADGGVIAAVDFASFGRPSGNCGGYAVEPSCHAAGSAAAVEALCVGQRACVVPMDGFGADPCAGQQKWLAVQASCSNASKRHTYWNFTLADKFFSDFWAGVDGNSTSPIPNFSTQPTWLYSPADYNWHEDANAPHYDYDRGAAPTRNLSALGDYYGRLWGYFKNNQMTDEYGNVHARTSGPAMDIRIIEVFNEVRRRAIHWLCHIIFTRFLHAPHPPLFEPPARSRTMSTGTTKCRIRSSSTPTCRACGALQTPSTPSSLWASRTPTLTARTRSWRGPRTF